MEGQEQQPMSVDEPSTSGAVQAKEKPDFEKLEKAADSLKTLTKKLRTTSKEFKRIVMYESNKQSPFHMWKDLTEKIETFKTDLAAFEKEYSGITLTSRRKRKSKVKKCTESCCDSKKD